MLMPMTAECALERLGERYSSMLLDVVLQLEPTVRFVDCPQQFIERGRFLDWPHAIERWTQHVQITPGKQTDGHDALAHDSLRNLVCIRNALKRLKCLAFHMRIGRPA